MKLPLVAFLVVWLGLIFSALTYSTNAYEPSALYGIWPFYALSLLLFCFLLASWREELFPLALISSLYVSSVAGLPYLKYPLLYGSDGDNMFHFSLAQTILNTGHVPTDSPYYGFTTFHSLAAMISMITGLSLTLAIKLEIFILPALVSLAGFWIAVEVLRKKSITKLAILGTIIAFAPNYVSAPQILAAFLVILSLTLVLQFARVDRDPPKQAFMISLLILMFAIVLTHHQTAFFALFALVGIGLLLPVIKGTLRTGAFAAQRIELVGLLALGFAYIWWTYYAGFTDLVRNVFSIVTGEPLQFQTTVGRGVFYYGPLAWTYRTLINYAQRGQLLVWTTLGVIVSGFTLTLRRRSNTIELDTHAIIFTTVLLFLGVYAIFLFVPFFVIGSDRFFRFISFVSPPFIAIGLQTVYSLVRRSAVKLNPRFGDILRRTPILAAAAFLLLSLIFVEPISPLLLGTVYHTSSIYQSDQITFLSNHPIVGANIISHLVVTNQFQVYAPDFPPDTIAPKEDSVSVLYALFSTHQLPFYSSGNLLLYQRVGPAGTYFEAANYYSNATWVSPTLAQLTNMKQLSLVYNSGEAFDAFST